MRKNDLINYNGFTLVELLIAMAISGIVAAAIFTAFKSQQDSYLVQDQVAEMQQNLRAAMDIMTREIRMAGFDPSGSANAGVQSAGASSITFDQDLNEDGDTADTDESIMFSLSDADGDGDNDLVRNNIAMADNIDGLEFYYTLADATQTLSPTDPEDIRAVQVTVLARTAKRTRGYTDTNTYITPGGQTWGPFNDNFRRRLLTTTIKCRNMGL